MSYKEVLLRPRERLCKNNQKIIEDFFKEFDNHIYFELGGSEKEVRLFVNNLDFKRFKDRAIALKVDQKDEGSIAIIDDVVDAVSKIGSYGVSGGKRVYVDFAGERKVKDRKVKDRKEKERKRNGSRLKPNTLRSSNTFPEEYQDKIICADSLIFLKKLPSNCVDVMITSPPYNFGLEYEQSEDDKRWDDYFCHLFKILKETSRVLKIGGRMIINVQPLFSDYIPTHHIISKYLLDINMLWKGEILWEKK